MSCARLLARVGAAVAGFATHGSEVDVLSAFLLKHGLTSIAAPLSELGVEVPADLLVLDEDDVALLKLKKVQAKKWSSAIAALIKST